MYNFKKEDTLLTVKFRLNDFIRQHNLLYNAKYSLFEK